MKQSIVLLGGGPTCFAAIRELRRSFSNLFLISLSELELSRFSKSVKYLGYADPVREADKALEILSSFRNNTQGDIVLVPTGDEYVDFLNKYKTGLSDGFNASIFSYDSFSDIVDKKKFSKRCMAANVEMPKTWHSDLEVALEDWADKVDYPCFIKPDIYHEWKEFYGLKKGFIVKEKQELLEVFNGIKFDKDRLVVQEIIGGEDDNIAILSCCVEGDNIKDVFTGRKLRQYPYGFGTTTMAISENIPQIVEASEKILKELSYKGVCDVEFKYDPKRKQYLIIEINARVGRWYSLVSKSGRYPLTRSVNNLLDNNTEKNSAMKEGIVWIFFFRDMMVMFKNRNIRLLKNIRYYLSFRKQVHCIFSFSDIVPFFMYFLEMTSKMYKLMLRK